MLTSTWHQSNSFLTSLEPVKIASSSWNLRTFKSLIQKKNKLLGRILGIQRVCQEGKGDFGLEKRENKLQQKLSLFLHQEEIMWFRRSKIKWLFDGDRNTKFYHTVAIQRRRRKSVSIIQSNYGVWIYDPIKFQQIFKEYQCVVKMFTSRKKISKDKGAEPTEFEESVGQALFDLENTNHELKSELKDLYINSAVQVDVSGNIHVPYRLRKGFRKIHVRLVRELEKKFSGKDVILIATRRIVRPPKKGSAAQRPRSRTLTAVHEAMLEDVVLPAEIVGKRTRYRVDGSKIMKVKL
ncbi:40S ribosomal protein S7 isoform X1 [Lathyrus oleraceus]|uniref:40S ribosomal protein S7 isoform X1 n=2 Tax=Pisum sativum TaxID=3888 RepID=UPI0021CF2262|nr:40S ribosomal protein S7-like isoform X1 [Pisum sativum]